MNTDTKFPEEFTDKDEIVAAEAQYRFTRGELHDAFNLVHNLIHWKNPIDIVVELRGNPERQVCAIRQAVIFFTGSVPTIEYTDDSSLSRPKIQVKANGYYKTIGA